MELPKEYPVKVIYVYDNGDVYEMATQEDIKNFGKNLTNSAVICQGRIQFYDVHWKKSDYNLCTHDNG